MLMESWVEQAEENLEKWGEQSWIVLSLATLEELGELAQALLEHEHEGGEAARIPFELRDVGALCYQAYWKATEYPEGVL